jgi:B9 domain-containing protein 1
MATDDKVTAPLTGAGFSVMISGQIESGRVLGYDSLSCEYFFETGPDWTRIDGLATGITQTAFRGGGGASKEAVWGMPMEIAFRSTNAYGWPRLGVVVSAVDSLGRPVIVGYGSTLVPLGGSAHTRRIRLFAPVSSTLLQRVFAWITANPPRVSGAGVPCRRSHLVGDDVSLQFWKANIVTQGTGREVTRVKSTGSVTVSLNVVTRGMTRHGYNAGSEPDSLPAEYLTAGLSSTGTAAAAASAGGVAPMLRASSQAASSRPLSSSMSRGPSFLRSSSSGVRPARSGSPLAPRTPETKTGEWKKGSASTEEEGEDEGSKHTPVAQASEAASKALSYGARKDSGQRAGAGDRYGGSATSAAMSYGQTRKAPEAEGTDSMAL